MDVETSCLAIFSGMPYCADSLTVIFAGLSLIVMPSAIFPI